MAIIYNTKPIFNVSIFVYVFNISSKIFKKYGTHCTSLKDKTGVISNSNLLISTGANVRFNLAQIAI